MVLPGALRSRSQRSADKIAATPESLIYVLGLGEATRAHGPARIRRQPPKL
jgi:hypothetical protein